VKPFIELSETNMLSHNQYFVVIPAGGSGQRFGHERPKQYKKVNGQTILEHTLSIFLFDRCVEKLVICLQEEDKLFSQSHLAKHPKLLYANAGATRAESVYNGIVLLSELAHDQDWIIVHDAVRPCLHRHDLNKLVNTVSNHSVGGILAQPIHDTVKKVNANQEIEQTIDRNTLWAAQTPQIFRLQMLRQALEFCFENGVQPTDEAFALEKWMQIPLVVQAAHPNPKLTTLSDLATIEHLLSMNKIEELCSE